MPRLSRRDFLATALLTSTAGPDFFLRSASAAQERVFEGIFPIMQTPFKEGGALDLETLGREAEFLHRAGAQGMTWPQLAGEYQTLTFEERIAGAEAIVAANRKAPAATRPAVVIGAQSDDITTAVRYARHAAQIGADGIIALPLNGGKDPEAQAAYYHAIGSATNKPLVAQAIGDMSVDLILRMARETPTLGYVKDEAGVTLPRLSEYSRNAQKLRGVFSGKHGPNFLDELARGACGNMPAAGIADLYVAAWTSWKAGRKDEAEEVFSKTLLLIVDAQTYGIAGQKYILQLRGVFPNTICRREDAGRVPLDAEAKRDIARTVNFAKRWFRA